MTIHEHDKTSVEHSARTVVQIVRSTSTIEGGGFEVYRPFPAPAADWFDPFLLLDEMAPNERPPADRRRYRARAAAVGEPARITSSDHTEVPGAGCLRHGIGRGCWLDR